MVRVDETKPGLLYRYDYKGEARYLIATDIPGGGERRFIDLENGDWYSGDVGTLRLLDYAELTLGRPTK